MGPKLPAGSKVNEPLARRLSAIGFPAFLLISPLAPPPADAVCPAQRHKGGGPAQPARGTAAEQGTPRPLAAHATPGRYRKPRENPQRDHPQECGF